MTMKNKEQLLYFCLNGNLRLSNYDYKFMANLQTMIRDHVRVTGNQSVLFTKLMNKYSKQLSKLGIDDAMINDLDWKTPVLESTDDYTSARITISNDEIIIKVPFNKLFIASFKRSETNNFNWNKETKEYRAAFSTSSLKIAVSSVAKYFDKVIYCEQTKSIVDAILAYDAKFWNPTLTRVGDRLVVMACNATLASHIQTLQLKADAHTFHLMSLYGIAVDPSLTEDDSFLQFSAQRCPEVEITELETVIDWMKELKCENAVIGRGLTYHASTASIVNSLSERGICAYTLSQIVSYSEVATNLMYLQHVSTSPTSLLAHKIIIIKDSRSIGTK